MMQDSLFSQPAPQPQQPTVESVSRVLNYVRRLVSANTKLAAVRVRGEVTGVTRNNGILRFQLAEGKDALACVVWSSDAGKFSALADGDEVICGGEFTLYSGKSQFQLIVRQIEYTGAGAIYAELRKLEEKLRGEGLFDTNRKKPMPPFPQRIAVVSARQSRGMNDFLTIMEKRAPFVRIEFVETRVQGDGAEIDIADALRRASRMDVDAIVLTRGGGSVEDLFAFNKEPVARAIAASPIPVMTAIGHNLDMHVSDQVASYHCETPSSAAQYFIDIGERARAGVERAQMRLDRRMREVFSANAQRFDAACARLSHASQTVVPRFEQRVRIFERRLQAQTPQQRLAERNERFARASARLESASHAPFRRAGERLVRLRAKLETLSPMQVLQRGYAIVTLDGKPLLDASRAQPGELIEATLRRGKLAARVEDVS